MENSLLLIAYNLCNTYAPEDNQEYIEWRKAVQIHFASQGLAIVWDTDLNEATLMADRSGMITRMIAAVIAKGVVDGNQGT